jgi:selenophosphate synthase
MRGKEKRNMLDIVLFYVMDKKRNKVKDMEIAIGNDDASKMEAYMKLKDGNVNITSDDAIMSIEVKDVMDAMPLYSNYTI